MEGKGKGLSQRTWSAVSVGVLLLSVALGILLYMETGDGLDALWMVFIVFGVYLAFTALFKGRDEDGFGPSESDLSVVGGSLLAGVGAAGLVYSLTDEVMYTAVVIIVVIAVVGIIMAVKNRDV